MSEAALADLKPSMLPGLTSWCHLVLGPVFTLLRPNLREVLTLVRPVQKFAAFYTDATFLKFYGNQNESTKWLFTDRFSIPKTPTFLFVRKGRGPPC